MVVHCCIIRAILLLVVGWHNIGFTIQHFTCHADVMSFSVYAVRCHMISALAVTRLADGYIETCGR